MKKIITVKDLYKDENYDTYDCKIYEFSPEDVYSRETITSGDLVLRKEGRSRFLEVIKGSILHKGISTKRVYLHNNTQLEILTVIMKKRIEFSQEEWDRNNGKIGTKLVTKNGSEVSLLTTNIKIGSEMYMSGYILLNNIICPLVWNYSGLSTITYPDDCYNLYIKIEEEESPFEPFQKVLVRDSKDEPWRCSFFSHMEDEFYYCGNGLWKNCIPYNEETKHLVGTSQNI